MAVDVVPAAGTPPPEVVLRRMLLDDIAAARARTDALFALVTPEGLLERPIAERHRLIFYLGHLEAFDWNLVCRDALGRSSLDATFEHLFAFGIDPIDGDTPADAPGDWPASGSIRAWTSAARESVDDALRSAPLRGWLDEGWAMRMAIEHRLMHAETLCYLLQRLGSAHKRPGSLPDATESAAATVAMRIPAGQAILGLSRAVSPHLGWDNEYERHVVDVPAFTIASLPVSNAEWVQFVDAGGYRERSLWDDAAWTWLASEGIAHPARWRFHDGRWWWVAMFGEVPLPRTWPVHVSRAEASAYARWKGGRLPTEPEWHRAAMGVGATPGVHGNFGGARFEPTASGLHPAGDSAFGVSDLVGNGWEWTSTPFAPFAGFEPLPFYPGYSANFFDARHFVLKGAGPATAAALVRPSFRNWFQPHYQHVHAKFRLVTDGEGR